MRPEDRRRIDEHSKRMLPLHHRVMMNRKRLNPNSPNHPDKLKEVGLIFRGVRQNRDLRASDIAKAVDCDRVTISGIEGGYLSFEDLEEGLAARIHEFYGLDSQGMPIDK